MILNYYSAIVILALLILLIENQDILLSRNESFAVPAWKVYRKYLFVIIAYYLTDIAWGFLESCKLSTLLFADTTIYFIATAAGVMYWTKYTVTYLEEERYFFGRFLLQSGRVFALGVTALSVVNVFMPVLFTVEQDCVYKALSTRYVILGVQIILLLLISAYTFTSIVRKRHAAEKQKRYRTLGLFGVIMAAFLTAQLWYPYLPLYTVAYMLGTCLLRSSVIGDEKEDYRIRLQEADRMMEKRLAEERTMKEHIAYARISALSGEYLSIHIVDPETEHYLEYNSNAAFKSLGLPDEGEDFFRITRELSQKLVYPKDLNRFMHAFTKENVLSEIERTGLFVLTYRLVVQEKPVYIRLRCAMVEEAESHRLIVGINDVDAQVKQEQEYERLLSEAQKKAAIDALTGVKSKYAYMEAEEQLNHQLEKRIRPAFAVIVLDVNDLKKVNDTSGHQAGDRYLYDASRIICQIFKRSPVFRIGGDEFAVIAQGHDYEQIGELMLKIKEHNRNSISSGGIVIACGMARFRDDDTDVASVFRRADTEMYADKQRLKETGKAQEEITE
ncbi:MAG: GGDEF domain-containing protein [Clostridiales bacterium]|nr:GGDEF domain-containing protein [Clostridiales bacterium]